MRLTQRGRDPERLEPRGLFPGAAANGRPGFGLGSASRSLPIRNALEREPNDAARQGHARPGPERAARRDRRRPAIATHSPSTWPRGSGLTAQVECRPLGSPADLDVSLIDPAGKTVNRLDTLPDGETTFRDPGEVKGPARLARAEPDR